MKIKTQVSYATVVLDCTAVELEVYIKVLQSAVPIEYDFKDSTYYYTGNALRVPEVQILFEDIKVKPEISKELNDE